MKGWWLGAGLLVITATAPAAQDVSFRSTTHAVALDVAVFDGNRAAGSLTAADFEVLDNDVPQRLSSTERNSLPLDLRLVFDTSGSINAEDLEKYRRAMLRVASALQAQDRIEVFTFNGRISQAVPLQRPPITIDLTRRGPDGTSFFDAVSLAMITRPLVDRRQITVVLSDARDNASFFDKDSLYDAARHTHAVVYAVLPIGLSGENTRYSTRLELLSRVTGGRLIRAQGDRGMGEAVIEALDEFRQGYVLNYTLAGVAADGWHAVTVRVRGNNKYEVRVRDGYFGR